MEPLPFIVTADQIIFFIIAFSTCACALLTVASRNIFHSAVWLSMALIGIAGIYFYLNAQFLGVIQVLVYIGGIITLFIFAIKLTAHIDDGTIRQTTRQVIPSFLAALAFFALLLYMISLSPWAAARPRIDWTLPDLGRSLMTTYILPFEFMSVILLAVMIGAIVIGKAKK